MHKTDSKCNRVTKTEKKVLLVPSKLFTDLTQINQMKVSKKWLFVFATQTVSFLYFSSNTNFTGPPHDIMAKPHKNSINQTSSYACTCRSTKNLLMEELEKVKPVQKAISNAHESVGGLEKSQSIGALPRGGNQAFYLRGTQSSAYLLHHARNDQICRKW